MGALIGESSTYPTWGRLRTPLLTNDSTYTLASFNKEWQDAFKTDEGNGLLRTDPTIPYNGSPTIGLDGSNQFRLFAATTWIVLDDRDANHLIGSVVTGTTDNLTITSDYLLAAGQTPPAAYSEPIVAIDNLTLF